MRCKIFFATTRNRGRKHATYSAQRISKTRLLGRSGGPGGFNCTIKICSAPDCWLATGRSAATAAPAHCGYLRVFAGAAETSPLVLIWRSESRLVISPPAPATASSPLSHYVGMVPLKLLPPRSSFVSAEIAPSVVGRPPDTLLIERISTSSAASTPSWVGWFK